MVRVPEFFGFMAFSKPGVLILCQEKSILVPDFLA
ncbi:unnamed protein product, partial [marine sediment metagenome]